jgi:hypothetical protein
MQHRATLGLLLATVALVACNDNPNHPAEPGLEGTYTATAFTVVTPDTVFDLLAEDVSLSITLAADGTTTGSQIVSGTVTDLTGQWDTTAATLRLHLGTPGLLTRTVFVIGPNRLQGDTQIDSFVFHLTLTK